MVACSAGDSAAAEDPAHAEAAAAGLEVIAGWRVRLLAWPSSCNYASSANGGGAGRSAQRRACIGTPADAHLVVSLDMALLPVRSQAYSACEAGAAASGKKAVVQVQRGRPPRPAKGG